MRKIPTLLVRDPDDRAHVTDEVTPGCEWVLAGEGTALRKHDGTCVMLDHAGDWWARREVKVGRHAPDGWWMVDTDEVTGKSVGWEPIAQSPFAKFHAEALEWLADLATQMGMVPLPGTFELIGPKINGNPERVDRHTLQRHSMAQVINLPTPLSVRQVKRAVADLAEYGYEGIVFHHPDGRMAKLKGRDLR